MRSIVLILVSVILASCASSDIIGKDENSTFSLESEEVGIYTRLFSMEAESRGLKIDTARLRVYLVDKFSPDLKKNGVVGLCTYQADKHVVFLDKKRFNEYDSYQKEMLVFHELGHCLLGLGHDQAANSSGIPLDLMFPSDFDSSYYAKYRTFYLNRMFNKASKQLKTGESDGERKDHTCRWGKHKRSNNPRAAGARRLYGHR